MKLTERSSATGLTLNQSFLHIVNTNDTSQDPAGSSYKAPLSLLTPLFGGGSFTGNTSGDCITDLYITNLHGCSPITVHDTITYVDSIIDSETTKSFIFGDSHVLTASTGTHGTSFDSNVILGGSSNRITPFQVGKHNTIIGGEGNKIGTPSRVSNSAIISSYNSIIETSALDGGNVIIGGKDSIISGGGRNVIVGGDGGVINSGVDHSVILGGQNITGTTNDTVYVPTLNIGTVGTGTSVNNLGIDISGNVVSATNEINDNLILEGTTNTSTSQAIYGVNIITSATTSDLATRLPDPTTGRQTVFINNSLLPIKVFPSVVGGEINGVVDGIASIPNDGRTYTFYCTQNPLPGAWTWSTPAIQQIVLQEMEINHTNGFSSSGFNAGQGTANESSVGLGWGGSGVVETGTWNTNNFPAWVEKFKVYSNIKWADIAGGNINVFFTQGYQKAVTGTGTGNKAVAQFTGTQAFPGVGIQEVLGGTAGDNVGDIGTLYMELPFTNAYPLSRIIGNQAVTTPIPGNSETCYSKGYYTFEMNINSNSGTKLYKFQWFIEYS